MEKNTFGQRETELTQLRAEVAHLLNMPLDGLTLGEVRSRLQDIERLEGKIASLELSQPAPVKPQTPPMEPLRPAIRRDRHPAIQMAEAKREGWSETATPAPSSERVRKSLSELNIGGYVMTVLAAALCLLALGVFTLTFWADLPYTAQWSLIMALGIGLGWFGVWRADKGTMRPFFLGLAGLGAGTLFIGVVAGALIWQIYGQGMALAGLLFWFVGYFSLAFCKEMTILYVISYIGGIIAIQLAAISAGWGMDGEIALALLMFVIIALGECCGIKSKSPVIFIGNMIFSWASVMIIRAEFGHDYISDGFYAPKLLPWIAVAAAVICLINVRWIVRPEWRKAPLLEGGATFLACIMAIDFIAFSNLFPEEFCIILTVIAIAICGIKSCDFYMMGAALPAAALLGNLSWTITANLTTSSFVNGCPGLIPSLLAVMLFAVPGLLERKEWRAGAVLFYISALGQTITADGSSKTQWFYAVTLVIFLAGLGVYYLNTAHKGIFFCKDLDLLIMSMMPGIICYTIHVFDNFLNIIPAAGIVAGLILYAYQTKIDTVSSFAHSAHSVFLVFAYLLLIFGTSAPYGASDFIKAVHAIIKTMAMVNVSIYCAARAEMTKNQLYAIFSSVFVHFNLFWISVIWRFSYSSIWVSLVGLALSAGLIFLGFRSNSKPMRQTALGCSILYVIKLAFVDIDLGGGVTTAGALLLAGLLCFGISLAYNRLSKFYGAEAGTPETVPKEGE